MFNLEVKNGKGKDEELVRPIWLHVIPLKLILEVLRQLLPVYDSDLYYTQTFGNRMWCASSSIYSEVQRTLLDEKSSVPKRKYLQIGPCSTCSSHVCARERKSLSHQSPRSTARRPGLSGGPSAKSNGALDKGPHKVPCPRHEWNSPTWTSSWIMGIGQL